MKDIGTVLRNLLDHFPYLRNILHLSRIIITTVILFSVPSPHHLLPGVHATQATLHPRDTPVCKLWLKQYSSVETRHDRKLSLQRLWTVQQDEWVQPPTCEK